MTIVRERVVAAVAIVLSVLVAATSVEVVRTAVEALLSAATAYGTFVVLAALGLSIGVRKIWRASRVVIAIAVVIGLALYGMAKSLAEVV
ncbi:hypothetical protein AB0H03_17600 [Streptomyces sparsogenes]|uniref:hypothetical protein n=1 Tax=Streptomyces sparsogenes TaxID=67365 RepID=UPI00340C3FA9